MISIDRSPSLLEAHGTSVSWTCSETSKGQANLVEGFLATRPSSWSPCCCPTYQAAHGQTVSHHWCSTNLHMCLRPGYVATVLRQDTRWYWSLSWCRRESWSWVEILWTDRRPWTTLDHYSQIWRCLSRISTHQVQRRSLSCVTSRFKVLSCLTQPLAKSSSKSWCTPRHILEFWDRFIYPIKRIEFEPEYRHRLAFQSMKSLNPWAPPRTSMP